MPQLPVVNPPVWELSHIAWFQERWCLRYSPLTLSLEKPSLLEGADPLFDSSAVPHATRWSLPYPPLADLLRYMERTLEETLAALERTPVEKRYFFALSLLHEDMHGEALLMTLQTLGLPAPPVDAKDPPRSPPTEARDIAFPGGTFDLGTAPGTGDFVFDNEKWAHQVEVEAFAIADRTVTQGEFAAFVEDSGCPAPRYWRREGSEWLVRRFDRWAPIDPHAPMVNVSLHEAQAYCRRAGRRLPTEAEWEYAARNGGAGDRYPWSDKPRELPGLDLRHWAAFMAPGEEATSRLGMRQMVGGVWEWTSSAFRPYPGFSPDPYVDYSQPWFESHGVLRGGCFATRSRLVHNRFRNFYVADRADAYAGFRTCAIE